MYCRLSRDDNMDSESNSIQNQKKILQKAAKEKGYTDTLFFVDDGITDTTMNRPGFQKMVQAIENGYISAVFVKELSRLGRNYIEVGRLPEEFFPAHDVRLAAISDGIDSDAEENEFAPFKNTIKNKRCLGGGTTKGGFMNFQMDKLQVLLHTAFTRPDRQSGKTL